MGFFLFLFLSVYTLMHLLVYYGVRSLLPTSQLSRILIRLWVVIMIVAPMLVRALERIDLIAPARLLAWAAYLWMGFLWIAFAIFLAQALWNGIIRLLSRWKPALRVALLVGAKTTTSILVLIWIAGSYAFFEARSLEVERIEIVSPKLQRDQIRIVQISDLHLGLIAGESVLRELVKTIRAQQPDLLLATGDILDIQQNHLQDLAELWHKLTPPLGKYAVLGNHELYSGKEGSIAFLEESGFIVLQDEMMRVDEIELAGVSDPGRGQQVDEAAALQKSNPNSFTILLKHRPRIDAQSLQRFDLQLSGHTHRGQIFPFNILTGIAYPLQDGLYKFDGGKALYTSRGTGCWGPPMRLFSPPEITVIDLLSHQR